MYTTRLTDKRQLTLSSDLLKTLHLKPGDTLELRPTSHGTLEVFPLRPDFNAVLEALFLGKSSSAYEPGSTSHPQPGGALEGDTMGIPEEAS